MRVKCPSCVFRAGNLMDLHEGRLKDLVDSNLELDTALTCHETLNKAEALCRGFLEAYGDRVLPVRLARAFNVLVEVEL